MIGIYKITNIKNKKMYIGKSIEIEKRWENHIRKLNNGKHENDHLQKSWNKYKEKNFKFEVIKECPEKELDKNEILLIKKLETYKPEYGYNKTMGGDGCSPNEETKAMISNSLKGHQGWFKNKKHSIQARLKMSKAMKGIKRTEENKEKISQSVKNLWEQEEHRAKMVLSSKGKKASKETKLKMSLSRKGHVVTEETRKKISKSNTGKVRKPISKETREKLSKSLKGLKRTPSSIENYRKASIIREQNSEVKQKAKTTCNKRYCEKYKDKIPLFIKLYQEGTRNYLIEKQLSLSKTQVKVMIEKYKQGTFSSLNLK